MLDKSIKLELEVNEDKALVVFKIMFVNQSNQSTKIEFSNLSRKAERIGLNIVHSGNRLEPEEFSIIKTVSNNADEKYIDANSKYEYELKASFERPGVLKFPGATYLLQPESTYDISFKYQNMISNTVSWMPHARW